MSRANARPRRAARALAVMSLAVLTIASGCNIVGVFGMLEESRRRNSTRTIQPEYEGLNGKTFAVVISADRMIQSEFPSAVPTLTVAISERLKRQTAAAGYVPGQRVIAYQYENPGWPAMSLGDLADAFGVERLVYIDLHEYRLYEPGNQYLWSAVASGTVSIVESDTIFRDEFSFQRDVRVTFLETDGLGPMDVPVENVATVLNTRFVDRASWLFYKHEEPYYPEY